MPTQLVLATGSRIRQALLRNAGVSCDVRPARVDEVAVRASMLAEGSSARDIADTLAEMKARRSSEEGEDALVLGCDQVLAHGGGVLGKPEDIGAVREQLLRLRGDTHLLISAAVICEHGVPVWRHSGEVRLTMRPFTGKYLDAYLQRNWESIRHSIGGYKLEEEGIRLFSHVEGDYFCVLGLPLLEVLAYLGQRGMIET